MKTIDKWNIDEVLTEGKCLTHEMAKILGEEYPLVKGWRHRLLGKRLTDEQWETLANIKESQAMNPKRLRKIRKQNGIKNTPFLFDDLM
jgi:hypothetical protein